MAKDYCTLFPDGSWGNCCKQHDDDYTAGSGIKQKEADERLRYCLEQGGRPVVGFIMFWGLRLFGWTRYRT